MHLFTIPLSDRYVCRLWLPTFRRDRTLFNRNNDKVFRDTEMSNRKYLYSDRDRYTSSIFSKENTREIIENLVTFIEKNVNFFFSGSSSKNIIFNECDFRIDFVALCTKSRVREHVGIFIFEDTILVFFFFYLYD